MPPGNGDIGLNACVTPEGDVQFSVSKTDAWETMGDWPGSEPNSLMAVSQDSSTAKWF